MALPNSIEVLTLFVDDVSEAKAFYSKIFEPAIVYQDEVSCVLKFDGAMVNLLKTSNAPSLVQPASVASAARRTRSRRVPRQRGQDGGLGLPQQRRAGLPL